MSVDEALAHSVATRDVATRGEATEGVATLRFYRWSPATLSLGYFQSLSDRDGHAASLPCPVVRRSTGGGAILHDRELTYSFVAPAKIGDRGAAEALYDLFHDTLITTLAEFGVTAHRQEATEAGLDSRFLCFERRAKGDLICRGAKIVGSAQRRSHGAILQHGSILLAASSFAPELPGIAELTGRELSPEKLREAWTARLAERADWSLEKGERTVAEADFAGERAAQRYGAAEWTAKR
ncbi:MAG TPA: lipoate--protein ligase family protein [Pirellulaceae bacterium]|nr:lipoate--protein ligase family protein [Pirellulaceae bacterium]